jgi:hypothetical protein
MAMTGARPTGQCLSSRGSWIGSRFAVRHVGRLATLIVTVVLLSGCTNPATDVTATSATLNGTVTLKPSEHGTFWWEYSRDGGATWTQTAHENWGVQTSSCDGSGSESPPARISKSVTGLAPGAHYIFRLAGTECGSGVEYLDSNGIAIAGGTAYDSFDTPPAGFSTLQHSVSDEFNGPAGSQPTAKWNFSSWCNVPSKDQSDSCFLTDPQHISLDGNGLLHLRAIRDFVDSGGTVWHTWTAGQLVSKDQSIQPPYAFIVRAKVAPDYGFWSAPAWAQVNQGQTGEIDNIEQLGRQPTGVNQSVHNLGTGITRFTDLGGAPLANDFHVYAAYVYTDHADYFVDGTRTATITSTDANGWSGIIGPTQFLISLTTGACDGTPTWAGCPTNQQPHEELVDWFRVYTP